MNLLEVSKKFPNQQACIEYLEQKRWNGKPVCPYCGSENTNKTYNQDTERFRHFCNGCVKSFSVTVGTIFEDSRLSLDKWFMAIALILNAKKGISSHQIARDVGIRQATAWSVAHRVRKAMQQDNGLLSGIVEMDETYVGGKPRKEAKKKDENDDDKGNPRGIGTKKECVVGMEEYKNAVEERQKKIAEYQQEISELQEAFAKAFGTESIVLDNQSILKSRVRVDPQELENAILEVVSKKPNLLTKEIHQEIVSSHGLQVIEETVRRKLEDLLKSDKIEKTDPNAERSVKYKIKNREIF